LPAICRCGCSTVSSSAGLLVRRGDELRVTRDGERFFAKAGIDLEKLRSNRRPLCRPCLDWSERRSHLRGTLGAAIFDYILERRWAVREARTRIVRFSAAGEQKTDRVVFQIVRYFT
jgi:hypothetical protein